MPLLPRSRRGTWLLAGAVWLVACAGLWQWLPVVPRAVIQPGLKYYVFDFSPDGRRFITFSPVEGRPQVVDGSHFGEFNIWDSANETRVAGPVETWKSTSLYFPSNDRRWWFLGPGDNIDLRHRLYVAVTGEIVVLPLVAPNFRSKAEFFPDSSCMFVEADIGGQPTVVLWDLIRRKQIGALTGVQFPIAASADGSLIAGITSNPGESFEVAVFNRNDLESRITLRGPVPGRCQGLHFTKDGGSVVAELSTDSDFHPQLFRTVRSWDVNTGRNQAEIHDAYVKCALIGTDNAIITVHQNAGDSRIEWHDACTGAILRTKHMGGQTSLVFGQSSLSPSRYFMCLQRRSEPSPTLEKVVSRLNLSSWFDLTPKMKVAVHETATGKFAGEVSGWHPRWSPDGNSLATLDKVSEASIYLWDMPPRPPLTWFGAGAALVALPIALVARWRVQKLRAA